MELKESKKFNSNQIISGNKSVNKLSSKGPGVNRPNGRFLEMEYDHKGRVTAQKAPVGEGGTTRTIWTFEYKPDNHETKVWDANNHKRIYYYSHKNRLTNIERYVLVGNSHKLYRREHFYWADKENLSRGKKNETDEGNLIAKALFNADGFIQSSTRLEYDECGNILTDELYGNLTGKNPVFYYVNHLGEPTKPCECYRHYSTYSDDGYNLKLSQKEDCGPVIRYKYQKDSDLLIAKFTCEGKAIKIREFFEYDDAAILIKKISDNGTSSDSDDLAGVTERHITTIIPVRGMQDHGVGQPQTIIDSYYDIPSQKEVMLERRNFTYDTAGLVKTEEVIDATGKLAYTLHYSHNCHGLLVRQFDAIGREFCYDYDDNFNKTREELVGSGFDTTFEYDVVNRLVRKTQNHDDGTIFTTTYQYDLMGNKIASTDHFGNTTNFEYDDLDRLIVVTHPAVLGPDGKEVRPQEKKEYDIYDNVIQETNPNGSVTKRTYNSRKQPLTITYPDGSEERFEYNLNGTLAHKWDRQGTKTSYTYDFLKRILTASTYDSSGQKLTTITNTYNALHLLSTCDAMGYTTTFSYDSAGRKIQELKQEGGNFEKITIEYDSLNRPYRTKSWYGTGSVDFIMVTSTFDNLGRVIAEERQDGAGTLLSKTGFTYDIFGNKTKIENFQALDTIGTVQTLYNSKNLPITLIDELGNTTSISYNFAFKNSLSQNVLQKVTCDPLGNQTVETYDALSRIAGIERYNAFHKLMAKNSLCYDLVGNKIKVIESDIIRGKSDHDYIVTSSYDSCNRLVEQIEQPGTSDEKKTSYAYTKAGFLETLYKPDGVQLKHTYDALGRLLDLSSTDNTVHYSYTYDKNNNPLEVYDHVANLLHSRTYDPWNRVQSDTFLNGRKITFQYDPLGRANLVTIPDGSSIGYIYTNGHLSDVVRYDASQAEQYRHRYTSVDLQEHVLESQLIGSCGTATFAYDIKNRPARITTPSWTEEIPSDGFDKAGNLNHLTITDRVGVNNCNFAYDDLYQLTKEDGVAAHTYQNDSLANRLAVDMSFYKIDPLNKITRTHDVLLKHDELFCYDKNGNLTEKQENGHTTTYRYDALNRLIEAKEAGVFTAEYLYDSLNRRLSKKITTPNGLNDSILQFIYWNNFEIAAYDSSQNLIHFRALGRGRGADVGAAIALELNGATYCPIHDARGNISELLSLDGTPYETMRYSAFGIPTIYDARGDVVELSRSPWLYASKRFDAETGFFHFAKRYYNPKLGRWVTPDPLGFADGPNLYAYVHLSPMILFDPYGLEAILDNSSGFNAQTPSPRGDTEMDDKAGRLLDEHKYAALTPDTMPMFGMVDLATWRGCWRSYRNFSDSIDNSNIYRVKGSPFEHGGMSYTNGMQTDFPKAVQQAEYLSKLAGGREITLCHNDTKGYDKKGLIGDVADICLQNAHFDTKAVLATRTEMCHWVETHPNSNELYLKICYSKGCNITRQALSGIEDENIRNRILVLAIEPGAYIDKNLCAGVLHLVSDRDYIPTIDIAGRMMAERQGTIKYLHACPGAVGMDHDIFSKTYPSEIKNFMDAYIQNPRKQ
jgi:RHS repeat-associated protein